MLYGYSGAFTLRARHIDPADRISVSATIVRGPLGSDQVFLDLSSEKESRRKDDVTRLSRTSDGVSSTSDAGRIAFSAPSRRRALQMISNGIIR
jgi:hypothetical protein